MQKVQILPYDDNKHKQAFYELNARWIKELFGQLEAGDDYELNRPLENIVQKGGFIFMAEMDGVAVGSFAMMKCANTKYDFELVKFAVNHDFGGLGIGKKLMNAVLDKAREMQAKKLFLESNTKCEAAVHLYRKVGFTELPEINSSYERCNIQMEMDIS